MTAVPDAAFFGWTEIKAEIPADDELDANDDDIEWDDGDPPVDFLEWWLWLLLLVFVDDEWDEDDDEELGDAWGEDAEDDGDWIEDDDEDWGDTELSAAISCGWGRGGDDGDKIDELGDDKSEDDVDDEDERADDWLWGGEELQLFNRWEGSPRLFDPFEWLLEWLLFERWLFLNPEEEDLMLPLLHVTLLLFNQGLVDTFTPVDFHHAAESHVVSITETLVDHKSVKKGRKEGGSLGMMFECITSKWCRILSFVQNEMIKNDDHDFKLFFSFSFSRNSLQTWIKKENIMWERIEWNNQNDADRQKKMKWE